MTTKTLILAAAGLMLTSTAAVAATITIYPTGVDNSYNLLAGGAFDPHYTQHMEGESQPYPQATVLSSGSFWWQWPQSTTGKWIAPGDSFDTGKRGWCKFRTTFDLAGLDPATARIDGMWTCDQYGSIQLNWAETGNTLVDGDYKSLHQFSVTSGFVAGVNTLDFRVYFPDGGAGVIAPIVVGCTATAGAARLVVNEVQSGNSSTVKDEDGDYSDWIEIYNAGGTAIDLQGYGLTDTASKPFKWVFPSCVLQPNRYLLVFASDKDRKTGPYFHTNFSIKASGEPIVLTAPSGQTVDQIPATAISQDMSYGRKPDGGSDLRFFTTPTPGRPNFTTGYVGALAAPAFSAARGFYTAAFNLTLSTSVADGVIHYTTDGSEPTETSPVYANPIPIPSGTGTAFVTTVVRARVTKAGYLPSPVETNTYFVSPQSTSRYALPVISLATTSSNFFDPEIGIYVAGNHDNYNQTGDEWERPIHVEFFEPGGACGFHCDAGVRIHGGWTRRLAQKSLRLYADHQGGPGSFNYRIFPESTLTNYKRIILRNYGNDNPLDTTYGAKYSMIRDGLAQSLVRAFDVDTQMFRQSVVFLNGQYWGLHGIVEREDKYWIQNHHPEVDPDNIDLIQQHPNYIEVDEGDDVAFTALRSYLANNDLITPANMDYARTQMDVNNVLIHCAANIYWAHTDWPGNNIRYWRERTATGKWRWAICDLDFGFWLHTPPSHDTLSYATKRGGTWFNSEDACITLASLMRNRESRDALINYTADMMNTVFKPANIIAKVNVMQSEITPYVQEYFTRWGAGSVSTWNSNVQTIRDFANARPAHVRSHFVEFFRLSGTSNLTVNASSSSMGSVTVNSVAVPSASLPWTGIYFNDVPIQLAALPAPGCRFVRWDGAASGTQNPLKITLAGSTAVTAVFEVAQ